MARVSAYQSNSTRQCIISGYHREADENCALMGHYAASSANFLPTFWDNLSVPSSGVKNLGLLEPTGCPETSVRNYCPLHNIPEELGSQHNANSIRLYASWAMTPCSVVGGYRCFGQISYMSQPTRKCFLRNVCNQLPDHRGLQPTTPQSKQPFPVIACEMFLPSVLRFT